MKIVELLGGLNVAITNEEAELLRKIGEDKSIVKLDLSEREQLIANSLVNKNVLSRRKNEQNGLYYSRRDR